MRAFSLFVVLLSFPALAADRLCSCRIFCDNSGGGVYQSSGENLAPARVNDALKASGGCPGSPRELSEGAWQASELACLAVQSDDAPTRLDCDVIDAPGSAAPSTVPFAGWDAPSDPKPILFE